MEQLLNDALAKGDTGKLPDYRVLDLGQHHGVFLVVLVPGLKGLPHKSYDEHRDYYKLCQPERKIPIKSSNNCYF